TASAMVAEILPQTVKRQVASIKDPRRLIADAVQAANLAIFERSQKQPDLQGMGTTTTALLFGGGTLTIGHVGDSRCYFLRPNAIWQATRDHSLVQEKLRAGLITREELKTDRMKNVITRSVGFEREVNVEVYTMAVQPGDLFLICSDGLSGLIDDAKILEIVQKHLFEGHNIEKAVQELVARANSNGGEDNITAILVQVFNNNS
ncbi:MAG: PP2C family protein-serine/threonine phosphatase, partial [Bdellovibrionota bacterium]